MRPQKDHLCSPAAHIRRDQIVAAADDHFRHYGYDRTTVGALAKSIGFSTAYIYKFFGSKQAIGEAICDICLNKIASDLHEIAASQKSPSERLRLIFRNLASHARELCLRERRLQEMVVAAHNEGWVSFRNHEDAVRTAIMQVVEDGRRIGEFERDSPIQDVCHGVMLVLEPFRNPTLWTQRLDELDDQALSLVALVLKSLAPHSR